MTCAQQSMIRCAIYRGGTSKAVFLLAKDLPTDPALRDRLILAIFGSPDPRQIDGLGGADSLTSKVAIIARSHRPSVDVDYTFGQVSITTPLIDYSGNCGNISSAVGPFAIDEGLVPAQEPMTRVHIFNTNTQKLIIADVPVVGGKACVKGECVVDGVPGSGAEIKLDFVDSGGSITGNLLPTGQPRDTISLSDGRQLEVSIVDACSPAVFVRAQDLGIAGTEHPAQLNSDTVFLKAIEEIRSIAAEMSGLVPDRTLATARSPSVPKAILVATAQLYKTLTGEVVDPAEIDLVARAMSMQRAHKAYPVTGSVATAAAAAISGSLVQQTSAGRTDSCLLRIGHPSGVLVVSSKVKEDEGKLCVVHGVVSRTARRIMSGYVYVPNSKISAHSPVRKGRPGVNPWA